MSETSLRFIGDLSGTQGILLAAAAAVACWLLYFRESRHRVGSQRWLLPTLRALAVFFVVLILSEPTLHHERSIRQLGRLFLFVDGSQSMELTDESMPASRKLASLRSLGMLDGDHVMQAADALDLRMEELTAVQSQLNEQLLDTESEDGKQPDAKEYDGQTDEAVRSYATLAEKAFADFEQLIRKTFVAETTDTQRIENRSVRTRLERLRRELDGRVRQFADQIQQRKLARRDARNQMESFSRSFDKVRAVAELAVQRYAGATDDPQLAKAIESFDGLSRWARSERLLLHETQGLVQTLASQQDIELLALRDSDFIPVWWQRRGGSKTSGTLPTKFDLLPNGFRTDLGDAIKSATQSQLEGAAILLISDGAHNRMTSSPIALARLLGKSEVPIFTVGVGSTEPARDIAITSLDHPAAVFAEDYVAGKIELLDHMTAGKSYRLKIEYEDEVVWEEAIYSKNVGRRQVAFKFPLKPLMERMQEANGDEQIRSCPLELQVTLSSDDETTQQSEAVVENNTKPMFLQAVTQRRKVLILDGRPRWESRYVRNLFQRQSNWEAEAFLDGVIDESTVDQESGLGNRSWRKTGEYSFPDSAEELFKYDLIVIGDLPAELLSQKEMEWIRDFVEKRGGGVVFMDGRRGNLAEFANTALGRLLPVEFTGSHDQLLAANNSRLALTDEGSNVNALRLDGSIVENQAAWRSLRAPKWTAPAAALPGSTTYARLVGEVGQGDPQSTADNRDVLVMRRFGAGRTLYLGSDELWRWRYNVGDRIHQRFWTQIANWIGMQPYAVAGKFVSIGTDQACYEADSSIALHVTMRDEDGAAVIETESEQSALIFRDGQLIAELPLEDDGNQSGVFRGRSGRLGPGRYEVAVVRHEKYGQSEKFEAQAELIVKPSENSELSELTMNEKLLKEMARSSGGQYFAEHELDKLQ
ncbi:MAG: hypothetical protein AAF497_04445, partial [Planctomycetota bacterium]